MAVGETKFPAAMDWSAWFRRALLKDPNAPQPSESAKEKKNRNRKNIEDDLERYGVTQQLIGRIKTFTVETFKDSHLRGAGVGDLSEVSEGETPKTSGNVRKDLSEWQERHASLVLLTVKEMSQLRYVLCPRFMKEQEFWHTYFVLVKSDVAEYELQAIRQEKLKQMAAENDNSSKGDSWELEMSEAKNSPNLQPSAS